MNDRLKSPRSKLNIVIESLEELKNHSNENQKWEEDFLGIDLTAARPGTSRQNRTSWEEFDIFSGIDF